MMISAPRCAGIIPQPLVGRHDCDRCAVELGAPLGSSLRNDIEAMGAELDIIARFKNGAVRISTFQEVNERKLHA